MFIPSLFVLFKMVKNNTSFILSYQLTAIAEIYYIGNKFDTKTNLGLCCMSCHSYSFFYSFTAIYIIHQYEIFKINY